MNTAQSSGGSAAAAPDVSTGSVLEARGLGKVFGHVRALREVSFELRAGEVLAVVGDNGAGKSTLIKILSGVYDPTEGQLEVRGQRRTFSEPREAADAGIATVYQDLALVETRDVAANLFLGREFHRGPFVDRRRIYAEAEKLLSALTIKLPSVRVAVHMLSGGQRQAVAIARMLVGDPDIVILDEPTAALGVQESGRVLGLIRDLRDSGKAVLLISHNLQQVWDIADRIMVMHLGQVAGIRRREQTTVDEIVKLIVYGAGEQNGHQNGTANGGTTTTTGTGQGNRP